MAHFDAGGSVDGTEDPLWICYTGFEVLSATRSPRATDCLALADAELTGCAAPLEATERASVIGNVPSYRAIAAARARALRRKRRRRDQSI